MNTQVRQKLTAAVIRASHVVYNLTLPTLVRVYHHVLLLGLPSHPRIAGRLSEIEIYICQGSPEVDDKTWDGFVKFILNDYKLASAFCWTLLLPTFLVATTTYNPEPVISRIAIVATIPPIFGIAQTACARWHLKSVYREPDAPHNWCKATVCNARSPFINTPALFSAPLAWMGWSIISFTVLLLAILFRGFPIIPCPNPQGSSPAVRGLLGLVNLVFACHSEEEAQTLANFSIALCICMAVTMTAGGLHLGVTAVYFTRLCLPLAVSPMPNVDAMSTTAVRSSDDLNSDSDMDDPVEMAKTSSVKISPAPSIATTKVVRKSRSARRIVPRFLFRPIPN